MKIITTLMIILFVILSGFDIIEVWENSDENTMRIVDSANNSFSMMIVLGTIQIMFIWSNIIGLQILDIVISMFCATWSSSICKAYQAIYSLLGHLPTSDITEGGCVIGCYTGECRITFYGYLAISISWVIVILHIILANKLRKENRNR